MSCKLRFALFLLGAFSFHCGPGLGPFNDVTAVIPTPPADTPGGTDSSFGVGGAGGAVFGLEGGTQTVRALAVRPDGKILVAGSNLTSRGSSLVVMQLTPKGLIDSDFGNQGFAQNQASNYATYGTGLTFDDEGRIYICGYCKHGTGTQPVIARFTSNGAIDTSFGSDGATILGAVGTDDLSYHCTWVNNTILLAGETSANGKNSTLVEVDETGGMINFQEVDPYAGGPDRMEAVAIDSQGLILGVGNKLLGEVTPIRGVVYRFLANLSLDTSFGGIGYVDHNIRYRAIVPDGVHIVVAGYGSSSRSFDSMFLHRYDEVGGVDDAFSSQASTIQFPDRDARPYALARQSNGMFVVAGEARASDTVASFALIRVNPDGSLDTSFNSTGKRMIDLESGDNTGRALAIQSDGKIVIAGEVNGRIGVSRIAP